MSRLVILILISLVALTGCMKVEEETPTPAPGVPDSTQQEQEGVKLIAITQDECFELLGNCSACQDRVWRNRDIYYIRDEPVAPYPECEWFRMPHISPMPWVWTPCFEQAIRPLIGCGDDRQYALSVSMAYDFDWVECRKVEP